MSKQFNHVANSTNTRGITDIGGSENEYLQFFDNYKKTPHVNWGSGMHQYPFNQNNPNSAGALTQRGQVMAQVNVGGSSASSLSGRMGHSSTRRQHS